MISPSWLTSARTNMARTSAAESFTPELEIPAHSSCWDKAPSQLESNLLKAAMTSWMFLKLFLNLLRPLAAAGHMRRTNSGRLISPSWSMSPRAKTSSVSWSDSLRPFFSSCLQTAPSWLLSIFLNP